jgi:hypothetical protein
MGMQFPNYYVTVLGKILAGTSHMAGVTPAHRGEAAKPHPDARGKASRYCSRAVAVR